MKCDITHTTFGRSEGVSLIGITKDNKYNQEEVPTALGNTVDTAHRETTSWAEGEDHLKTVDGQKGIRGLKRADREDGSGENHRENAAKMRKHVRTEESAEDI